MGPVEASRQVLSRVGMTINDMDLIEVNEDFAANAIPVARHLDISWEKLNVYGDAIALGHLYQ